MGVQFPHMLFLTRPLFEVGRPLFEMIIYLFKPQRAKVYPKFVLPNHSQSGRLIYGAIRPGGGQPPRAILCGIRTHVASVKGMSLNRTRGIEQLTLSLVGLEPTTNSL